MKAIKKEIFRDKYFTHITFEYRGCIYEVKYANGWNVCCTPAWIQHRDEQAKIDEMLDHPSPVDDKEHKKEHKTFEEQMNEIWEMWEA